MTFCIHINLWKKERKWTNFVLIDLFLFFSFSIPYSMRLIIHPSSPEMMLLGQDTVLLFRHTDWYVIDRLVELYRYLNHNESWHFENCRILSSSVPVHFLNWFVMKLTIWCSLLCSEKSCRTNRNASEIIVINYKETNRIKKKKENVMVSHFFTIFMQMKTTNMTNNVKQNGPRNISAA